MPCELSWLVEKRVVYTRMTGYVTGHELEIQNEEMKDYLQQSHGLLHTITDATDSTGTDLGLRDLQKMQFTDVPNLGWAIYISPSKLNRFFASVITQLSKKRGRQFETLEEGLHFLQEMDESLPPLSVPHKLLTG